MKFSRLTASCLLFLLIFSWMIFLLGVFYPGLVTDNGQFFINDILVDKILLKFIYYKSELFVSLIYASLKLNGDFSCFFILQFLISAFSLSYFYYLVSPQWGKKWPAIWALFFILIPVNSLFLIETERDGIFAWLGFLTLLQLLDIALYHQQQISWRRSILLGFTACLAGLIRPEGYLYAFILPLQVAFFSATSKFHQARKVLISVAFFYLFLNCLIMMYFPSYPKEVSQVKYYNEYFARQTLFIIEESGWNLSEEDKNILSPFIDLNKVQKIQIQDELGFRQLLIDSDQSIPMQLRLRSYYFKMIFMHPDLFLKSRWAQLKLAANITIANIYFSPKGETSIWPAFRTWYLKLNYHLHEISFFKYTFFKVFMAVILGLFILLLSPWMRGFAVFTVTPVMHLFYVFLAQAIGKPKYFYFSYLCIVFFAPMFIEQVINLLLKKRRGLMP